MPRNPVEFTLELTPRARVDVIDVRRVIASQFGDALDEYPRALCCSFHTTAGYLDRGVAARLGQKESDVMPYIDVFRTMFPEGAGYEHDKMDRRTELSEEQKPREPLNADSHLAFMAGALRTCVSYPNRPGESIAFIDLDGVHDGHVRQRRTTVLGYTAEETVAQSRLVVPVSTHSVDSVNLKDPSLGVYETCAELVATHGVTKGRIPSLRSLGLEQEVSDPLPGGEAAGRERLKRYLADGVRSYHDDHDQLGGDRSSRLSAYLHFGCVSAREVEDRLPPGAGPDAFRRQLCWRDFYAHVLFHHPRNARSEFQERYRGMRWSRAEQAFTAWCDGRTGFPLVDAGMRQLRREGWMHNRARLVVGSFLTKDLGIDWRLGERWFMRHLIDGDEANNNGNWQWIASVGVDPQPFFRRIYNPARHMERFDPEGDYVRRYVPELRPVPDRWLR